MDWSVLLWWQLQIQSLLSPQGETQGCQPYTIPSCHCNSFICIQSAQHPRSLGKIFKGWACSGSEQRAAADLFLLTNTKQAHWGFRATSARVCWRMRKKVDSVRVCVCVVGRCLECFSCFRASYPIIRCWLWRSLERKTDENKQRGNSKGKKQRENDKTYMALIDNHALYQFYLKAWH